MSAPSITRVRYSTSSVAVCRLTTPWTGYWPVKPPTAYAHHLTVGSCTNGGGADLITPQTRPPDHPWRPFSVRRPARRETPSDASASNPGEPSPGHKMLAQASAGRPQHPVFAPPIAAPDHPADPRGMIRRHSLRTSVAVSRSRSRSVAALYPYGRPAADTNPAPRPHDPYRRPAADEIAGHRRRSPAQCRVLAHRALTRRASCRHHDCPPPPRRTQLPCDGFHSMARWLISPRWINSEHVLMVRQSPPNSVHLTQQAAGKRLPVG